MMATDRGLQRCTGLDDGDGSRCPRRQPTSLLVVVALLLLESLTLVLPVRGDDPSSGASLSSQWLPNLTSEAFSRAGGEENGQEQHHSDGTATSTDDENRPERYYNDGTPLSIEELDKEVHWPRGLGLGSVVSSCSNKLDARYLPEVALARPYSNYLAARLVEEESLARSIAKLLSSDSLEKRTLQACNPEGRNSRYRAFTAALVDFYNSTGIPLDVIERHNESLAVALECDLYLKKGMRNRDFRDLKESSRFPHLIFWEYPLFWRSDPAHPERTWSFINWDHLNGYMFPYGMPADRWQHYFADHIAIKPWIGPRPNGYAVILGQVPSDTTTIATVDRYSTDVFGIYRKMVESIHKEIPGFRIIYRPHPHLEHSENYCVELNMTIDGAETRTSNDDSLEDVLAGTSVAMAISSASLIEAAFMGIPTISLDYVAAVYRISCHSFDNLRSVVLEGTACRPPRAQWLYDLAYTMWNEDDIRNGNVFRYLFRAGEQHWGTFADQPFRFEDSEYME